MQLAGQWASQARRRHESSCPGCPLSDTAPGVGHCSRCDARPLLRPKMLYFLPEVAGRYNISKEPNDYAIAGSSSGGMAAFNAAWNRPQVFHRVLSFIGSFTNLRGGEGLASRIRKTEPKPRRVFLQDGRNDQDIYSGNWFLANQEMFSALEEQVAFCRKAHQYIGHERGPSEHGPEGFPNQPGRAEVRHIRRDRRGTGGGSLVFSRRWRGGHGREDNLRVRHVGERRSVR